MPIFGRVLVAGGFLWISLWAIVGSLLGAKINSALFHGDQVWIAGLQRELMRAAHAHMNSMSYSIILMGLSAHTAVRICGYKLCQRTAGAACVGMILFGTGLTLEAFFPTERGDYSPLALLTGFGGVTFIGAITLWGLIFVWGAKRGRAT